MHNNLSRLATLLVSCIVHYSLSSCFAPLAILLCYQSILTVQMVLCVLDDDFAHCFSAFHECVCLTSLFKGEWGFVDDWGEGACFGDFSEVLEDLCVCFSFEVVEHRDEHEYDVD